MNEIVVVGSGFGGIAAALRARSLGFNVTIVEKLKSLGGRAQVFKKDGFVFDAGPTVITAPQLFDELFLLFDKKRSDYIDLISLDVWYQFIFNDLSKFNYGGTLEDIQNEISKISAHDALNYKNLLDESKKYLKSVLVN
ncbi:phytoene desaturase family protein [Paraphotobacterium marinum]|uniref:phytoene desaturase family protein n=1 Tax=Paraphotobacterium marinum TaxID=1755811 RepID=UPI001CEF8AF5|nr:NAD(P)-binding protein [Paraphotobacterium marinum]